MAAFDPFYGESSAFDPNLDVNKYLGAKRATVGNDPADLASSNRAARVAQFGEDAVAKMEAAGAKTANYFKGAVAPEVAPAAGFFARNLPTLAPAIGFGAKTLAAGAVPAMEAYNVYNVATDPNATKLDVAGNVAAGTSRILGSTAGAMLGAKFKGPPLAKFLVGAAGGALGYAFPDVIDRYFGTGANKTSSPAPTTVAPATINNVAGQSEQGTIPSSFSEEPMRTYGTPSPELMAAYQRQQGYGAVAERPTIGSNAYGIPADNMRTNTVNAVTAPDGSKVYTNFGARSPSAMPASEQTQLSTLPPAYPRVATGPSGELINPQTGLPFSSMMRERSIGNGGPMDVINLLNDRYNMVRSLGAEKQLEKRDLGRSAVQVAQINADSAVRRILAQQEGAPVKVGLGETAINPRSGSTINKDLSGNISYGKIGGAKEEASPASVKAMAGRLRSAHPGISDADVHNSIKNTYPGVSIPKAWIGTQ